jgi:hypothetical protein
MTTIENSKTDEATSRVYVLHLIASKPSQGDVHVNPDATAQILGEYATRDEAHRAGRRYLRDNPSAWVQVQLPGEDGEDVSAS